MKAIQTNFLLTLFFLIFISCSAQQKDPIPEHETIKIQSKQVGEERTINIWTPESYKTSQDSFMVLYMPDGGIQEDFPHIANTLNDLIKANKIPAVILVGIENTVRKRDLTGPTSIAKDKELLPEGGGSEKFRAFIEEELIPEINKKYRVTNKKGIIGESLAGLFVTETLLLKPELFDFYIAFDPSIWWNDAYLVKQSSQYLDKFPSSKKTFWFAGSSATDISGNTKNLAEKLKTTNPTNIVWKYSDEKKEKHNTIFRATKEKAIIWTLNNLTN